MALCRLLALTIGLRVCGAEVVREELFDGPILSWEIQVSRSELAKLRGASNPFNDDRPEALGTVRAGSSVWTNVAIHLKGAAGSFRPVDQTPALTLNFGKYAEGQTCFGHRKLHLNNSIQDAGRMDELLVSEMYLNHGVPTPRATHGFVHLNGRRLGLYVVKGGWDKPFLKQHFGSAKGNLYDGGFTRDIDSNLPRDSGEGDPDWKDLANLRNSLRESDPARRLERVGGILDVERFTTLTAIQVLVDDWDGYVRNRNNYRIYHDPGSDRLVFMAHGMDQLWRNPRSGFAPRLSGQVANRLFAIPEMSERLAARMKELTNSVYNAAFVDGIFQKARERLLRAYEAERRPEERQRVLAAMQDTRDRIRTRMALFGGQSYKAPDMIRFGADGVARITQWSPSPEGESAEMVESVTEGDRKVLLIRATGPFAAGSWRSRVTLPEGRYRFEARLRTRALRGSDNSGRGRGAGIRVSGSRRGGGIEGDSGWQTVRFDFSVPDANFRRGGNTPDNEVVLIAELKGDSGSAEFDLGSMTVTRLNGP